MLRVFLGAAAVLALCAGGLVADDKDQGKNTPQKGKHARATITKVDPKNGTVTVRMKDKQGKEVEKTFRLTEEVRYIDSTGRVAAADIFRNGDQVLVVEEEGRLKEMRKPNKTGTGGNTGSKQSTEKRSEK
jgi:hypothetical protein